MRFFLIHKEAKWYQFQNGIRNQINDCMGQVRVKEVCGTEGSFWHYGNFLYHDLDDVYTGIHICQTSSNCPLKMCNSDTLTNVITKKQNLTSKLEQLSFPCFLIIFSKSVIEKNIEILPFSNKYLKIQQNTSIFFLKAK